MRRLIAALLGVGLMLSMTACGTLERPEGPLRITDGSLLPTQDPRIRSGDAARLASFSDQFGIRFAHGEAVTMLALSGGGANGAYGAGLLVGWTEHGDRPKFDIVTGVSTGALAAPFAFLGSEWDPQLRAAYTDGGASNLLSWRSFAAFLYPSLFSNSALRHLVDENVTPELLQAVAREHATGRRLLVATTDLDSQDTVIWDMGLLATQGDENAVTLFKQVLVASASIPGVFPPILIAGMQPDNTVVMEMHVDGGVNTPFLAIPDPLLLWTRERRPGAAQSSLYVIVNGQTERNDAPTPGRLTSILMRSYDSMSKASLRTHLTATTAFARRNGMALSLSAIPGNVQVSSVDFDEQTMNALFDLGRTLASSGQAWVRLDTATIENPAEPFAPAVADIPEPLRPKTPKTAPVPPVPQP